MQRGILGGLLVLVTLGGCAPATRAASPAATSSASSKCGKRPLLCANGFEQCVTDKNGCDTCTCTSAGGYNSLDPRMPP